MGQTPVKLVVMCKVVIRSGWKRNAVLPLEYESKEKFVKDFMRLAKAAYKKLDYNYGRGAYFEFLGKRFEAWDYYFEFSNGAIKRTPPIVLTLEYWFEEQKMCQEK